MKLSPGSLVEIPIMKESGNLIAGRSAFNFYVSMAVFPSANADCTDYI